MRFNPISVIPQQTRSTTPDTFITSQYGKLPAANGDGRLTITQAARLSKIVNGLSSAFTGGLPTKIISGFYVDTSCVELLPEGHLKIQLPPGKGIIGGLVFQIPTTTEYIWENFLLEIPQTLLRGNLLIYLRYKDPQTKNDLSPLPQNYPHLPTRVLPENQAEFGPVELFFSFYDPDTQKLVGSDLDQSYIHLLVAANIKFDFRSGVSRSRSRTSQAVFVDENDHTPIQIDGQKYYPQGGGFSDIRVVDGGYIGTRPTEEKPDEVDIPPVGVHLLYSGILKNTSEIIQLGSRPLSTKFFVFFNGVLYYPGIDWKYDEIENTIRIDNALLTSDRSIYVFENIKESEFGNLQHIFSAVFTETQSSIEVPGVESTDSCLVFRNGLLESDVTITKNRIRLSVAPDDWVIVIKILSATSMTSKFVELAYQGSAPGGSIFKSAKLKADRKYLVFYNGILYQPKLDYQLKPNTLLMKFQMNSTKNLTIIGI